MRASASNDRANLFNPPPAGGSWRDRIKIHPAANLFPMMSDEELIQPEHITLNTTASIADLLNREMTLKEFEIQILQHYLDKYDKDVLLVAKKLDVGKSTLYRMIQNGELKMK